MIIEIDFNSEEALYMQLRNQIILGIATAQYHEGDLLPSVRAMAEEIGINSMTVNKAYQLLKQEGYIITDRRNGVRVRESFHMTPELPPESKEQLKQLVSEARVRGVSKEEFVALVEEYFGGGARE